MQLKVTNLNKKCRKKEKLKNWVHVQIIVSWLPGARAYQTRDLQESLAFSNSQSFMGKKCMSI